MSQNRTYTKEKQDDLEKNTESNTCSECGGDIITNEKGENICSECGLIADVDNIDRGKEWRAFTNKEKNKKSRVGAPTTKTMHDKGLSTKIDWRDKDASGEQITGRKRKQINRLRKWDEHSKSQTSREKNLRQALGEIKRMGSALGLGKQIIETASVLYRRCLDEDLLPGRSIEGVASACIYAASRQCGTPRSLDEVGSVSRINKRPDEEHTFNSGISNTYRYIAEELNLKIKPTKPEQYLTRFISELDIEQDMEVENKAKEIIEVGRGELLHSGRSPTSIAAGAIYTACKLLNIKRTQNRVGNVANVSNVTVRNRYKELLEAYKKHD